MKNTTNSKLKSYSNTTLFSDFEIICFFILSKYLAVFNFWMPNISVSNVWTLVLWRLESPCDFSPKVCFLTINTIFRNTHTTDSIRFYFQNFRCIGVYQPRKLNEKSFTYACKILPISTWVLSFFPLLPILFQKMGRFGLECRTRTCTIINADKNGDPIPVHPKEKLVGVIWIICIVLFVVNVAVYIKVKVMHLLEALYYVQIL